MSLEEPLPQPTLAPAAAGSTIVDHFLSKFGLWVDPSAVPEWARARLLGARLPEPPEAQLLDRVLQLLPAAVLGAVTHVLIVDNGNVGPDGGFLNGIIRLNTPALRLHLADPDVGGIFSRFTVTVMHEFGHAVYTRLLAGPDRAWVVDRYLTDVAAADDDLQPSDAGAEHYFVSLFVAAALRPRDAALRDDAARALLRRIGFRLS